MPESAGDTEHRIVEKHDIVPEQSVVSEHGIVPEHVLAFVHVPKCGGTTVHDWLVERIAPSAMCPQRHRMPAELQPARLASLERYRVFSGHFDVVDLLHLPGPQHRFTVLREPIARIVSLYDFWRAHTPEHIEEHDLVGPRAARSMTFDEFALADDPRIVHDLDNTFVRTFTGLIRTGEPFADRRRALDEAVAVVDSFDHVGHLDRLDGTFGWLRDVLGLDDEAAVLPPRRNVLGEWNMPHLIDVDRTVPSASALTALEPLVELDRELIARCC